jgi:hypothetical protein
MSRRVNRDPDHLDSKGIRSLPPEDIRTIFRGSDDLTMRRGRHLLTKILKGSRAKDVLSRSLDQSPAYGFYKGLSDEEVLARVDWVIRQGYLAIEYDDRLPLLADQTDAQTGTESGQAVPPSRGEGRSKSLIVMCGRAARNGRNWPDSSLTGGRRRGRSGG